MDGTTNGSFTWQYRAMSGGGPGQDEDDTNSAADPTPAELEAWRVADLATAVEWAEGRLIRARQLGDVEIVQHLGNLLAEVRRARSRDALAAQVRRIR